MHKTTPSVLKTAELAIISLSKKINIFSINCTQQVLIFIYKPEKKRYENDI